MDCGLKIVNFKVFSENISSYVNFQVIVMTAQILLDLVNHALFDLRKAALLIFDECHHALGHNHPYRAIMRNYISLPQG